MNCKNCKKITPIWGLKSKKYCNTNCKIEYEKKSKKKFLENTNCIVCKTEFIPKNYRQKCCTIKCKMKFDAVKISKKPNSKICSNCKKDFNPYSSLMKFCSANCRIENVKKDRKFNWNNESVEKRKGVNNPSYINADRVIGKKIDSTGLRLFQRNRKDILNEMINNQGYTFCEKCKQTNNRLEAHHLIYRSEKPRHKNLHDKENITLVCVKCHNWYHQKKGNRNEIVLERNLHTIFGNDVLNK